jgi:hypothetical protein
MASFFFFWYICSNKQTLKISKIMENTSSSPVKSSMLYGLYLGIALVFIHIIQYIMDIYNPPIWVSLISYAAMIGIIFWGQKKYRDEELGGFIPYGKSLGFGVLISLFAAIIYGFYFFILVGIIDTEYMSKLMDVIIEKYEEMGMTDDQIEVAVEMVKKFQSPIITVVSSIFSFVLMGTIFSLITSIFVKKEKPLFD